MNIDFWSSAVLIVSKTESLTKSHARFLENFCFKKASEIGRYGVENASEPARSHITEQMEADVMDLYEDMKVLLSTLGFPLLEPLLETKNKGAKLFCRGKSVEAFGYYTNDGLVVMAGSRASKELAPTTGPSVRSHTDRLLASLVLADRGDFYEFVTDHLFETPSRAASVVLARNANGWIEFKDKAGKTLDALERH